jgi:hypothetical protein
MAFCGTEAVDQPVEKHLNQLNTISHRRLGCRAAAAVVFDGFEMNSHLEGSW